MAAKETKTKEKNAILAIDLGGTKVLCAVVTVEGAIIGRAKASTRAHPEASVLIKEIGDCARQAIAASKLDIDQIQGAGIGIPGPLNTETGVVRVAPNLGWHEVPAKELLEKELGIPVFVDNDVRVAMIAEHYTGAARGYERAVGLFVGTGVGGGVVVDGEIYRGRNTEAGEVGHMIIKAGGPTGPCGQQGCVEALSSRTAITRDLRAAIAKGKKTTLTKTSGKNLETLGSGELAKAIQQGDKLAVKVVGRSARYAGIAIGSLVNLLNPDVVILGGGVVEAIGQWYVDRATAEARKVIISDVARNLPIVQSTLGDDAGVLGAAQLVRLAHNDKEAHP